MKKILALLAVMASVVFVSACGKSPFDTKKVYQIIAKSAPRYIEIRGSVSENASTIHINDNANSDSQKWLFIEDENGFYHIVSNASGKCLELTNNIIHLADLNQEKEQKWILLKDREGYYLIISRTTGQAFDLTGAALTAGTPVGAFWSHAEASQKWSIVEAK